MRGFEFTVALLALPACLWATSDDFEPTTVSELSEEAAQIVVIKSVGTVKEREGGAIVISAVADEVLGGTLTASQEVLLYMRDPFPGEIRATESAICFLGSVLKGEEKAALGVPADQVIYRVLSGRKGIVLQSNAVAHAAAREYTALRMDEERLAWAKRHLVRGDPVVVHWAFSVIEDAIGQNPEAEELLISALDAKAAKGMWDDDILTVIEHLRRLPVDRWRGPVQKFIEDANADPSFRIRATRVLVESGDKLDELFSTLVHKPGNEFLAPALMKLEMGLEDVLQRLKSSSMSERYAAVREAARHPPSPELLEALVSTAKDADRTQVRLAVVKTLMSFPLERSAAALAKLIRTCDDELTRETAVLYLVRDVRSRTTEEGKKAFEDVDKFLKEIEERANASSNEVKQKALKALDRLKGKVRRIRGTFGRSDGD